METEKLSAQQIEEEEEDDGPPPGFQPIINNTPISVDSNKFEQTIDEDADEGPPPGFEPVEPVSPISKFPAFSSDKEESNKQDGIDDDDGPPPGWEFNSLTHALPEMSSITTEIKIVEKEELNVDEEDDDGPPPGWDKLLPHQMPPPRVLQPQQSSNVSSDLQLRSKQDVAANNDQEPQIVSENNLTGQSSPLETPVQQPQLSTLIDMKREETEELNVDEEDEGPPPGWENVLPHRMPPPCVPQVQESSNVSFENNDREPQVASQYNNVPGQSSPHKPAVQQSPPPNHLGERGKGESRTRVKRRSTGNKPASPVPLSPAPADIESSTELAQLVCGACYKLCTYPRGAKWVQCPSCMEVNLAMEEHEIGQVKCNGCALLLMYPYGSPAVQCSSCHTVIEIGAHNRRAPLSEQQNQRQHPNQAH